ncbi:MAG: carbamoyl-phosphate synthase large subunit [Planctomycetes bacterium]|nr:carbamoyl-phosphate synthase large subunit [Planctomycetota bacterium]
MPRRDDLETILVVGSGPIVIGQACEFDYSGTQAVKALKEEGYRVVLLNSNPATIMTDPGLADATYVEPITSGMLEKVIAAEKPDAVLPTLGGQTALNVTVEAIDRGVMERHGVKVIGAGREAIRKAEDRKLFKEAMEKIGLDLPVSGYAYNMAEAMETRRRILEETRSENLKRAVVIRPSFTMGGWGGGVAYNVEEFEETAALGLDASPISEILIEEYLDGWKEYELEVMRDAADNVVIVCSIENFDPMGVHTGDSITVAPAQTLTDKEYQLMRDASKAVIREIGVETGGSNIQFGVHPGTGRQVIIEMNPRVSRSSALASKATGFPIARIAAKLAVGYSLDEIPNDITKETPASFEPTIDYVVVKVPRWNFDKFPETSQALTTRMKSVGEVMTIGRTFREALQKALAGLEAGRHGLGADPKERKTTPPGAPGAYDRAEITRRLAVPGPERVFYVRHALRAGMTAGEVSRLSGIDPWFVEQIGRLAETEKELLRAGGVENAGLPLLKKAKSDGFTDVQIGTLTGSDAARVRAVREAAGLKPTYKLVDTCAAEFEAYTPYFYSTYEDEDEARRPEEKAVMILGGGPNRIGQGIEFDYCCCHSSYALRELGYRSIMVNSNPETVSTDYDTSDLLFFEPLTFEHVMNIWDRLRPEGVIVQFGGQTPLNLAGDLERAGVRILGTPVSSIMAAEDRGKFEELARRVGMRHPEGAVATAAEEVVREAERIGYPVLVRPSYVLGGLRMRIVNSSDELKRHLERVYQALDGIGAGEVGKEAPILVDKFLQNAVEVDVDAIADGENVIIGGVMEHIEEAGVHSGDSSCVLPPHGLDRAVVEEIKAHTRRTALELGTVGLMNVQYAVKDGQVFVLEVNPRASRTIPFVSKATGVALAKHATAVMLGKKLPDLGLTSDPDPIGRLSIKVPVFPFERFSGTDIILSPEMKSTGEVMGIDAEFGTAFAKASYAAGVELPREGTVFISVNDADKPAVAPVAKKLQEMGFGILCSKGTREFLAKHGVQGHALPKIQDGMRPNIIDFLKNREVNLVINTPTMEGPDTDEARIRRQTIIHRVPCVTTVSGARALVEGIAALRKGAIGVKSLQEYYAEEKEAAG